MQWSAAAQRWVFRRHWWVIVLAAALGAVAVPLVESSREATYEATSLVVARTFSQTVVALPKYGQTIFADGGVAAAVARELGLDSSDRLIPDRLRVDTPQDSLVFSVIGVDGSASRAVELSTAGAEAFVAELNKAGPTVGVFVVQSEPNVPAHPVSPALGTTTSIGVGLLVGVIFGVGLLVILVQLRRPLLTPGDVWEELELQGLGVLTLPPRYDRKMVQPEDVPGSIRLTRQILESGVSTVFVVADPGDAWARQQTAQVIALAMVSRAKVAYLGAPAAERDVNRALQARWAERHPDIHDEVDDSGAMVVVDVLDVVDMLSVRDGSWGVVLLGPSGSSRVRFDRLLGDFTTLQVLGVVLYGRHRRQGDRSTVALPSALEARVGRGVR